MKIDFGRKWWQYEVLAMFRADTWRWKYDDLAELFMAVIWMVEMCGRDQLFFWNWLNINHQGPNVVEKNV